MAESIGAGARGADKRSGEKARTRAIRQGLAALTLAALLGAAGLLGGCGGSGGGSDSPPPTAAPNITPASGGSVQSADGKLQLSVPAGAASAEAHAGLATATPDATTAADPDYLPGSSYAYEGEALSFSNAATLNFDAGAITAASLRAAVLKPGQAPAWRKNEGLQPERMCQSGYAAALGLAPHAVWVNGTSCPAGCEQGVTRNAYGVVDEPYLPLTHCFPPTELFIVTEPQTCPAGSQDVTAEAVAVLLPTQHVCQPLPPKAAPQVALGASAPRLSPCVLMPGSASCKITSLPAGARISWFQDKVAPVPTLATAATPGLVQVAPNAWELPVEDGTTATLNLQYQATDNSALAEVELRELFGLNVVNGTLSSTVLARATSGGALPPATRTAPVDNAARTVAIPYASTDAANRWFYVRAVDAAGNVKASPLLRVGRRAGTAPVIASFVATPAALGAGGGTVQLSWSINGASAASIAPTVGNVNASGGSTAPMALDSTRTYTLTASNANGSSQASVTITVAADTLPPAVSLAASSQNVVAPGSTTLTASASDNLGVARVEFYEGATLRATRTAPPYTLDIAYSAADAGAHSYTARAFDAADNPGSSAPLVVQVSLPSSADRYVNPAAGNDANDGLSAATAYKTLGRAFAQAGSGGTVWLADGSYTAANEGLAGGVSALRQVPAGLTVRASNDGLAVMNLGLALANGGTVIGLAFDGLSGGAPMSGIDASGGTVTLSRLSFQRLGQSTSGGGGVGAHAGLRVHGTAVVTLDHGAGQPLTFGASVDNAVLAFDTARLTVTGGRFEPGIVAGCQTRCVARVQTYHGAEVTLAAMAITVASDSSSAPQPWAIARDQSRLTVRGGQVSQVADNTSLRDLAWAFGDSQVTLENFQPAASFRRLAAVPSTNSSGTPTIRLTSMVIDGGFSSGVVHAAQPANVVVSGSSVRGITGSTAALHLTAGGSLTLSSSNFLDNERVVALAGTANYSFSARSVSFNGNSTCGGACYTLSLAGGAGSSFDLGTAAEPALNLMRPVANGRGLVLAVNAAVTVQAVGVTWLPNVQGADANGRYALGSAPCSAGSCTLSAGSGANFHIGSGALKLAGN